MSRILATLGLFSLVFLARPTRADDLKRAQLNNIPGKLVAQIDDGSEAYDPFADYNEFEEATEEEADINFFRNGRFLTLQFYGGYRAFTGILGELYKPSADFGIGISYFFDLRFAMQVSYITGDHAFKLSSQGNNFTGSYTISQTAFDFKYYLNTQNVTRGLAKFNPYIIGGFAQIYRSGRIDNNGGNTRDGAIGFQGGLGFEIPMMRNKMYIGLEGVYQYVNFPDANNEILIAGAATGIFPRGNIVRGSALLGINF